MLNPAGAKFDFGNVIFAVLETCEHRRLSYDDDEAADRLMIDAREKLAEIEKSYIDLSGTRSYWQRLKHEILQTVMPKYIAMAVKQNAVERHDFGIWRGGDILARIGFGVGGLLLASFIRFIPGLRLVWLPSELAFAIFGILLPEIIRWRGRKRHSSRLNALVVEGERFQSNRQIHYLSEADLEDLFTEPPASSSETAKRLASSQQTPIRS